MSVKYIRYAATIALILALFVVMLGAYTRLTDAGLGCPDWPGCYGHMVLPDAGKKLLSAQQQFPDTPVEPRKAWTEMAHRYAAGTLALLILFIGFASLRKHLQDGQSPWQLPVLLMLLVVFQAALGMWTVTLKLLPIVVMSHLLGGILIFSCLCRLRLQLSQVKPLALPALHTAIIIGCIIVFYQIALGGWVSANYAGIACIGFPQCNGQWLPEMHVSQGFNLFSAIGTNYQGGVLDNDVRVTIQFIHRLGAIITAVYTLALAIWTLVKIDNKNVRFAAGAALLLVIGQFSLGIMNVVYLLPLPVAVAHNGVAALLFATMLMLAYLTRGKTRYAN